MMFKGLFRILCIIIISGAISLCIIEKDETLHRRINNYLCTTLSHLFKCNFVAHVQEIDIFNGSLILQNVQGISHEADRWHWHAPTINVTWSWRTFFKQKKIALEIYIPYITIFSQGSTSSLEILPHIKALITPAAPGLPIALSSCTIQKADLLTHHPWGECTAHFGLEFEKYSSQAIVRLLLQNSVIKKNNYELFRIEQMNGEIRTEKDEIHGKAVGVGSFSFLNQKLVCHASIAPQHITVSVQTGDGLSALKAELENGILQGEARVACKTIGSDSDEAMIIKVAGKNNTYTVDALWPATHVYGISIASGKIHGHYALDTGIGAGKGELGNTKAAITIENTQEQKISLTSDYFKSSCIYNKTSNKPFSWTLTFPENPPEELYLDNNNTMHASLHLAPIIKYLKVPYLDVPRDALVSIVCKKEADAYVLSCEGNHLLIRVPGVYNVLDSVNATITYDGNNEIHISKSELGLHQGSLAISEGRILMDQGKISELYLPVLIKNCFVGLQKDVFTLLSGTLYINKAQDYTLSGYVLLDRSHVRNNVLSPAFQKSWMPTFSATESPAINLNLLISTRLPTKIRTDTLETSAKIGLKITGTSKEPRVDGTVELIQGAFIFPYQPLYISRGTLYFSSDDNQSPWIDISAKNSIKKYAITMTINGSAAKPQISFSSSPMLEHEQIITLLFGGSEDGTLFLALPKLGDSLNNLLLGEAQTSSSIRSYLTDLLRPLKQIRLVPSLSDQKGRGGLRGSIIIEVDERLRGLIQQNFSLTEDIRWEIEYDLSNDTTVRAVRDEHSDVGAELEMRWKF